MSAVIANHSPVQRAAAAAGIVRRAAGRWGVRPELVDALLAGADPQRLASLSGTWYADADSDSYGNARVLKFASDGRLLQTWGTPGTGPGEFDLPHGIAIDAAKALRDGTAPEALRKLVLQRASAAADARDIVAAPPSPVLPKSVESPIVAAAKKAASAGSRG